MKSIDTVLVRRATVDDAPEIAELADELLREIMIAIGIKAFDSNPTVMREKLCHSIPSNQHFILIAQQDDIAVGFAALTPAYALYTNGPYGIITELFVLPKHRSQSIGERLVQECKQLAVEMGWTRLEVTTPPLPEFDHTLRFYENRGFAITGGRKLKHSIG